MCYFCASVGYDFYFGQQFEQTTDISIRFSRASLQKKHFNENFWRSDNRGSDNRGSDNRGCTVLIKVCCYMQHIQQLMMKS